MKAGGVGVACLTVLEVSNSPGVCFCSIVTQTSYQTVLCAVTGDVYMFALLITIISSHQYCPTCDIVTIFGHGFGDILSVLVVAQTNAVPVLCE